LLHRSITANLDQRRMSTPVWRGDFGFVMCRESGEELSGLFAIMPDRRRSCLIDLMAIDPGGTTSMRSWQPSPDGCRIAYTLSREGGEDAELYVLDVLTGETLDGPIGGCGQASVAWLPTGDQFYLSRRAPDVTAPAGCGDMAVYLHLIGTDVAADTVILEAPARVANFFRLATSSDGHWLAISMGGGSPGGGNDLWLGDLHQSGPDRPDLRLIQDRPCGNSGLTFGRDELIYVVTNRDAPRKRIAVVDPARLDYAHWRELIAEDPIAVISDFAHLRDRDGRSVLAVSRIREAIAEVALYDGTSGSLLGVVPLPGQGSVGALVGSPEPGDQIWFTYTDMVTPPVVLTFRLSIMETSFWEDPPALRNQDARTSRIVTHSKDGTDVQMMITEPIGRNGPLPCIVSGYGGFGVPMVPAYSASVLSWVQAGGIYVVANVRGGGERGKQWHAAGSRQHKQNSIHDFIACAEYLVATGWTSPDQLAAFGGSNGGLLVGAAITQRPELFAAAVCTSPLMDMVRYELLGFGPWWRGEYGSASDPEELGWLLGYSPYHRVSSGVAYPATLLTTGANDDRVDPAHARKMTAALQHATAGGAPIVLRQEEKVGHGSRSVSRSVDLSADILAFVAEFTGGGRSTN
jgi:prolyl oligopeptidase